MERTFVMLKPDAMQRGLAGEILARLEKKGLVLVAAKMTKLEDAMLDVHYAHHKSKPFFPKLKQFMKSSPVFATVWQGKEAVKVVRDLVGPTNGRNAPAGTIRGDYSNSGSCNLIHASDSVENAELEIKRFFKPAEIAPWQWHSLDFLYSPEELEK